ncbi:WS/DGAT/MGAT family O-acyltransferase [Nocardia sp. NPDC055029]
MVSSNTTLLNSTGTKIKIMTPGEVLTTNRPIPEISVTFPAAPSTGDPHQLSSLDLHMLDSETSTTPMHIGGVTFLDSGNAPRGPLDVSALRRLYADRLHSIAPLRRRIRTVPLGLDRPYWEDCTTVDLGYHIRSVRMPPGSTDQDLADYMARRHIEPLDRSKPLWECYLVSGLSGGRQAIYWKTHHAVIDGVAGGLIMAELFDETPEHVPTQPPTNGVRFDRTPDTVEMLARSAVNGLRRQWTRAQALVEAGPALVEAFLESRAKVPSSPFNGPITAARSVAFTSLPLDAVKHIKSSIGCTVNDVVMALCTSALRRWMLDHGHSPHRSLMAAVPVTVRTPDQFGAAGNQFSFMFSPLPVAESDPRSRLKMLHNDLVDVKGRFQTRPPTLLHHATSLLTPLLHGLPTRALLRATAPALPLVNLLVSNVAGPQYPQYLSGIRAIATYPVSALSDPFGSLNITVVSSDGQLNVGILACPDLVPDVWDLTHHLEAALLELQQ